MEIAREAKRQRRTRQEPSNSDAAVPDGAAPGTSASDRRALQPRSRVATHAVFLVPGLLGFERFSTFSYFADRVVAALRAGLEQELGHPVPVVALPIPATASLAQRQRYLVKTLANRLHELEHGRAPLHVHLVGHSTGGVDANLLTAEAPVSGVRWTDLDPRAPALRERIRSVTSIASPHQGACIVRDPAVRFVGARDLRGLPAAANVLGRFALSAACDVEISQFLVGSRREGGKAFRFASELLSNWALLRDLEPSRSTRAVMLQPGVVRRSFVAVAGHPVAGQASTSAADAFFRDLSRRASGWTSGCAEDGELLQASVARLNRALAGDDADELVIKAPFVELPRTLDAGHNDGVVNAARQLIDPDDPAELAGIVAADHFDLVGYYDRHVWRSGADGQERPTQVLSGLLHSGSGFRDDEFFELYRRAAQVITQAIG